MRNFATFLNRKFQQTKNVKEGTFFNILLVNAYVCTENGFTLEFQHSAIKPEERQSREEFYKNMNWVVDCTRLKNDFNIFRKIINNINIAIELAPISLPVQNQGNIKIGSIVEINYAEDKGLFQFLLVIFYA